MNVLKVIGSWFKSDGFTSGSALIERKMTRRWFKSDEPTPELPVAEKRIAFIDGDQPIPSLLSAYRKYIENTNTTTFFVRVKDDRFKEPKSLKRFGPTLNRVFLSGFSKGKEITDKYIAAAIQKAITDGYTHITVVSSDYDFVHIFKLAVAVEPKAVDLTFRLLVPNAQGRMKDCPAQISNIEVVKLK